VEQLKAAGLAGHYADHDKALFYVDANGNPFTVTYIQAKGDPITDLHEDMAAEQKARSTYEWLINLSDDPCVIDPLRFLREREVVHFIDPLRFLREREVVHFQRFGEALMDVQEFMGSKKCY